jgi:hypothetical protein
MRLSTKHLSSLSLLLFSTLLVNVAVCQPVIDDKVDCQKRQAPSKLATLSKVEVMKMTGPQKFSPLTHQLLHKSKVGKESLFDKNASSMNTIQGSQLSQTDDFRGFDGAAANAGAGASGSE